jgi:hypothetical protein
MWGWGEKVRESSSLTFPWTSKHVIVAIVRQAIVGMVNYCFKKKHRTLLFNPLGFILHQIMVYGLSS